MRQFVGLDNYRFIFTSDPVFWIAFKNTVIWTIMCLIFPPLVGLLLALGLNQKLFGRGVLRAVILSTGHHRFDRRRHHVALDVRSLLRSVQPVDDQYGNGVVHSGLARRSERSRSTACSSRICGIRSASRWCCSWPDCRACRRRLIEAARIDGAGRWGVFRHVTLPALTSTITVVLVLSVINSLKAFDIVYGLTGGGPAQSTQMLALWAFTQAMQIFDYGRGGAISVVLLLITVHDCRALPALDAEAARRPLDDRRRSKPSPRRTARAPHGSCSCRSVDRAGLVVALIWIAPFVFMIFTSLKTNEAVMATGAFTPPPELAWQNYSEAWERGALRHQPSTAPSSR